MTTPKSEELFFVTGGTLGQDAPSYVERAADRELCARLENREFCYVLTSRQMGKSSLMIRTSVRLRERGCNVVVLDLTGIGQNLTLEQWYDGLILRIGRQLRLENEMEAFWSAQQRLSPVQRLFNALRDVVLPARRGPLIVFVDEIDVVRSLPFSTDEFFSAIRESYNRRVEDTEFNRLGFCLLGVATPADLIRDARTTPFNIGHRVELSDFTVAEASVLAEGLRLSLGIKDGSPAAQRLIERTFFWTRGHPYLTQRLCRALVENRKPPGRLLDTAVLSSPDGGTTIVDQLCAELFLSPRAREVDDNLLFVRERILRSEADLASLLGLYEQIRHGQKVRDTESHPLIDALRLSGITRVVDGFLEVRNRIYHQVFDGEWVAANRPEAELEKPDGDRIRIKGTCSIGRAAINEVALPDAKVSRRHAMIHAQEQNEFWLADLGSSNGTFLNGRRVSHPMLLRDGDEILIGEFRFLFHQSRCPQRRVEETTVGDKTVTDLRAVRP
jgi:hypothetical protein